MNANRAGNGDDRTPRICQILTRRLLIYPYFGCQTSLYNALFVSSVCSFAAFGTVSLPPVPYVIFSRLAIRIVERGKLADGTGERHIGGRGKLEDETGETRIAGLEKIADETGEMHISGRGKMEDATGGRRTAGRGKMADETGERRIAGPVKFSGRD